MADGGVFGEGIGAGPHGLGYHVVERMVRGLENRGHCLVIDNFYKCKPLPRAHVQGDMGHRYRAPNQQESARWIVPGAGHVCEGCNDYLESCASTNGRCLLARQEACDIAKHCSRPLGAEQ